MKNYKTYSIAQLKYIKIKISSAGKKTYWAKIDTRLKRIAKSYFLELKKKGIGIVLNDTLTKKRCLGLTKKGLQCNRLVKSEHVYCFQHKNSILSKNLNKVLVMDCISGLKKIPKESASIIICDPPYNINKNFGNDSDRQEFNKYLTWCKSWIKECLRVLRKDGLLYIYGFSEILANIQVNCVKNSYVRWVIWHYTNKVSPRSNFWQRSHESILCCSKVKTPYFNKDLIREPYTESYKKASGRVRKNTKGRFGTKTTVYCVNELGALPRDVIKIPALSGSFGSKERVKGHPTQKPLVLCEKLIKSSLNKNNLLIVPFSGSGSECVAAKKLNVPFIGFEINSVFVALAESRLNEK